MASEKDRKKFLIRLDTNLTTSEVDELEAKDAMWELNMT